MLPADAGRRVILTREALPPVYGIRDAALRDTTGAPLYLAGLLTEASRTAYIERCGMVVVEQADSA